MTALAPAPRARGRVDRDVVVPLEAGWEAAAAPPDAVLTPGGLDALERWPARVPGTAAGALDDAGIWDAADPRDLDAEDWWFRTRFDAPAAADGEEVVLRLDGVATHCEVHLNGELLGSGSSMFARHAPPVGTLLRDGGNELAIRCRALRPMLTQPRRPRARWRTRLADGALRFHRTALLGRAPGIAPAPAAVGPWRPVTLERRRGVVLEELALRARRNGGGGVLTVDVQLRDIGAAPAAAEVRVSGPAGVHAAALRLTRDGDRVVLTGDLHLAEAAPWWPHTHGTPVLHDVVLALAGPGGEITIDAGRVGFRDLAAGDVEHDGLNLRINGCPVFARGAVWTPVDPLGLAPSAEALDDTLRAAVDAGMNMLRVPGVGAYESDAFHDRCDALGILIWQDFMFANFDYPFADPQFAAAVDREARDVLARVGGRPSTAVLCGGSEVEQQAAMVGLDPELGRTETARDVLPRLAAEARADAVYVPSAPCGGDLPFRPAVGIATYFGVGAYRRPPADARLSGVRFAAECLAFANVADGDDAGWVPRDDGADWSFADVRDHYLAERYGPGAVALRATDPGRYRELSAAVTGELMADVMGEWRRPASPSSGGLVLWLRDQRPGDGWGLLDHHGAPKAALGPLRRALAPLAVWTTDEGLGGIDVHVANDGPAPVEATLRIALYHDFEQPTETAVHPVAVPPHGALTLGLEQVIGRFVDAGWAYRFGPPAHDLVVVSLSTADGRGARTVRFPVGPPSDRQPAEALGLRAWLEGSTLVVAGRRLVHGARVHGARAADDGFFVEPGTEARVDLRPGADPAGISLTALNLEGVLRVAATAP